MSTTTQELPATDRAVEIETLSMKEASDYYGLTEQCLRLLVADSLIRTRHPDGNLWRRDVEKHAERTAAAEPVPADEKRDLFENVFPLEYREAPRQQFAVQCGTDSRYERYVIAAMQALIGREDFFPQDFYRDRTTVPNLIDAAHRVAEGMLLQHATLTGRDTPVLPCVIWSDHENDADAGVIVSSGSWGELAVDIENALPGQPGYDVYVAGTRVVKGLPSIAAAKAAARRRLRELYNCDGNVELLAVD